jgi:hypothetical protein
MVSIGGTHFDYLNPVKHMIKRLRFERDNIDEFWFRGEESLQLHTFVNAAEVHAVLCEDGDMQHWHGASEDHGWPCPVENVFIADPKNC